MSAAASRQSRRSRRACHECRDRKARFQHAGSVKADRDHTLCFACYRAQRERQRAQLLANVPSAAPLPLPFEEEAGANAIAPALAARHPALDARQVAHRRRMLTHMEATARSRDRHRSAR
jgi:hypothetical protein